MREPDAVTVPSVTSEQSGDRDRTAGGAGEGRSGEGHSRVRRGRELASLYATARAITALDEVDTVLASIVRHAHELLGADVTYLSVYDETDGHLRLRGVEGAVSATFAHAHVPPDIGVAGRILATGAPFWVSDYLGDTTLKRDPGFDAAAAGEGLAAMLGVPLRDKAGVFGALFVAERFSRSFAVEEVALLSAVARWRRCGRRTRRWSGPRRCMRRSPASSSTAEVRRRSPNSWSRSWAAASRWSTGRASPRSCDRIRREPHRSSPTGCGRRSWTAR
jgi:hypothetical protein